MPLPSFSTRSDDRLTGKGAVLDRSGSVTFNTTPTVLLDTGGDADRHPAGELGRQR